jgi:hypothetical protein
VKRYSKFSIKAFRHEGFQVIANVFNPNEIEEMRQEVLRVSPPGIGYPPGDLLSLPGLRHVLLDDRVLSIMHCALGETPVYWGDSSANIELGYAAWHKDNPDRNTMAAPDWEDPYTIFRCAIYLQDHSRHSGGLNVRAGSHLRSAVHGDDPHQGRTVYVASQVGDLVVWPLTMTHSAKGYQLRYLPKLTIEPCPEAHLKMPRLVRGGLRRLGLRVNPLSKSLIRPSEKQRMGLFMTFGKRDHHLTRYIQFLKTRKYMIEQWQTMRYDADAIAATQGKDIDLLNVWETFKHESDLGLENFYAVDPFYQSA